MNSLIKKGVAFTIILLCVSVSVIPSTGIVVEKKPIILTFFDGNTLYVGGSGPGNYSTIQEAIDNASDGDTILVFSGTYNEWIRIHKQLFIKGIKKPGENIPIINGGNDHDTVIIYANGCSFEDFKVRNGPAGFLEKGITLHSDNNVIKNCEIFNTGTGLYLDSSCNNSISNNHMHGGHKGFQIKSSHNNTFLNNRLNDHNNHEVEFSEGSENNLFINNTVIECGSQEGLELVNSDNNIIIGNNISNNYRGLVITKSSNIAVKDNVFWRNGIVITGTIEQQASHTFENNLVNGKPFYYYGSETGIVVPEDAGQIVMINCTYCTIKNCNISRVDYGIRLTYSSNNTITNNFLTSTSPAGISLSQSHDNLISRNYVRGCREGILLGSSNRNVILNNTVEKHNNHIGIGLSGSDNNMIADNEVVYNRFGIDIAFGSNNNEIIRNNVIDSTYIGIWLYATSNNFVLNNNICNSSDIGIRVQYTATSTIEENNITKCKSGIICSDTESNEFSRNIINKIDRGISISNSEKDRIFENHITNNLGTGISLSRCGHALVFENHITNNLGTGISLSLCGHALVEKNNLIGNVPNAFFIDGFKSSFTNKWRQNYWEMPLLSPKVIAGELKIVYWVNPFTGEESFFKIPWVKFDWRPAQEPYDI